MIQMPAWKKEVPHKNTNRMMQKRGHVMELEEDMDKNLF